MNIFELAAKITLDSSAFEKGIGLAKGSMAGISAAIGAAGAAVGAFATQSLEAYASYEQLVGGVETLFGDSADTIKEYADAAYQTAGMSANEYMETVTAFSASLINSLEGDTDKAAEQADKAIRDMSDNANKMGVDIENIQNAYRGFARGNYTMLDNLSLGYAGTKEGMEQLLARAEEIAGVHFDIASYSDIIDAIHVIQEDMGIAGTTAREASETIEGSVASMKSSWSNLVVELAKDNGDIEGSIDKLIDSVLTVGDNVIPRVEKILNGVMTLIRKGIPKLTKLIPKLVSQYLPEIISLGTELIIGLTEGITENLSDLMTAAGKIVSELARGIITLLPMLADAGLQIILQLADYLTQNLPVLLPKAVEILMTIVDKLLESDTLSLLVDASLGIIMALADYLLAPDTINKMVEKLPEIVQKIVDGLVKNTGKLLDAALAIIGALFKYLTNWDNLSKLLEAGADIIGAVIDGIEDMLDKVGEAALKIAGKIAEKLGFGEYWEAGMGVISDFMDGVHENWEIYKGFWSEVGNYIWSQLHPDEGTFRAGDAITQELDPGKSLESARAQKQLERVAERATGSIESFWDNARPATGGHRRAKGGVVRTPEYSLVGEAGAEVIMPLENNTQWIDMLAKRLGNVGNTVNITVNATGDVDAEELARRIAEAVDNALNDRKVIAARAVGGTAW